MRVLTGTSGFSYPAWKGAFYPDGLPAHRMLAHYATRLDSVEVNATFYRMPRAETLAAWRAEVPAGFVFALKAPQRVTHVKRLRDVDDAVAAFYRAGAELGPALGPILYQLPPSLKKDVTRLEEFLALVPSGGRSVFEFRHPSWWSDDVYEMLRAHGAALCLVDADESTTPDVATAGFGYLRLRRAEYTAADLRAWTDHVLAQGWSEAFVYFKHEDEARGPAFALAMREALLGERASLDRAPGLHPMSGQW